MLNFSIFKKYSFLFLMLSIFIPSEILGMHHERELDKMKINNLYDDWYIAVETSDIQGYVDSLDENIVLIPPGGPVITGKENYRTFLGIDTFLFYCFGKVRTLFLLSIHFHFQKSIKMPISIKTCLAEVSISGKEKYFWRLWSPY